jgi:serine/threonine protein kinase
MLLTQPDTKAINWWSFRVFVYEMLFGLLPFWNENRDLKEQSIVFDAIRFPFSVSFDAQNLIFQLLNRNSAQRIGAGEEDVEESKCHSFFRGIDWPVVLERLIEPEWKPKILNAVDISNFDLECVGARTCRRRCRALLLPC